MSRWLIETSCILSLSLTWIQGTQGVRLNHVGEQQRVDVSINGRFFTSYQYGSQFRDKPVFYPVLSPRGNRINRGFPIGDDIPGESQDHPHHASLFFAFGAVNGLDFWSPEGKRHIQHQKVTTLGEGQEGLLGLLLQWIDPEAGPVLLENRQVIFGGTEDAHWMDHRILLTALQSRVVFGETKEGFFALRVADSLREEGGQAQYLSAFGWKTSQRIWGTRAPWVALQGQVSGEEVTIVIFDHPSTENHPSYWHARAYGLFAANPFGRKDFVKGAEPVDRPLQHGESFRFRYRLVVYHGKQSKDRLDADYLEYIK